MKLDKDSDDYRLFSKYVKYEQLEELKRAVEVLIELKVMSLSKEILTECTLF